MMPDDDIHATTAASDSPDQHNPEQQQTLEQPEGPAVPMATVPGYRLKPEIARGGMGVVYAAECLTFGREVAIKVMKSGMSAASFNREARITARLPHPGIPPVHALGTLPNGLPYLVMKLIRGETLDQILKNRADLETGRGRLIAAFESICQAVGYAHAQGIIHRDLKPSNVMVGAFGEVQVMDWGLAKEIAGDEEITEEIRAAEAGLTVAGQVKGTPEYMAPEQARGEEVDARADVFALGGILAAILTGHAPFGGTSVMQTITRAAQCDLGETLERLDACGADRELVTLCRRCLMATPDDRPADGVELAKAVAEYRAEVENRLLLQIQRERDKLAVVEYGRTMQVAHQEWRDGNITNMRTLLCSADPKLRGWEWRYLNRLSDPSLLSLHGHTDVINSVHFSPDGKSIVTASDDKTAKVWDAKTGMELLCLNGHTGRVTSAYFNPNGKSIATASDDKTAKLWDAKNGHRLLSLEGHISGVNSARFSSDGERIVTASHDRTAKVWDVQTGLEIITLKGYNKFTLMSFLRKLWKRYLLFSKGHLGSINFASFSPDGNQIATAGDDKTIILWDAITGNELARFHGHMGNVLSVSYSLDGRQVITASDDGTARIWDTKTGTNMLTIKGHNFKLYSAFFSSNGNRVITASWNKRAYVWDANTGVELRSIKGHTNAVRAVSFSPCGDYIATGSDDTEAKIWDSTNCMQFVELAEPNLDNCQFSLSFHFKKDENYLTTVNLWEGKSQEELFYILGEFNAINSASFSSDGKYVVTANGLVAYIWNPVTGEAIGQLYGHKSYITGVCFSSSQNRIATSSGDNTAKIWDVYTGKELFSLIGHSRGLTYVCFSPDDKNIVTSSADKTIKLWDSDNIAELCSFKGHTGWVLFVSFNFDGSRIVSASLDKTAKVWNAKTGMEVLSLKGHANGLFSASFSPDGKRIVTGSMDKTAKVWNAETGEALLSLEGHTDAIRCASFSKDGKRIITASDDATAKVWDAKTGAELLSLKGHSDRVISASISADGNYILTGSWDKTAKVWDARPYAESFAEREAAEAEQKRKN